MTVPLRRCLSVAPRGAGEEADIAQAARALTTRGAIRCVAGTVGTAIAVVIVARLSCARSVPVVAACGATFVALGAIFVTLRAALVTLGAVLVTRCARALRPSFGPSVSAVALTVTPAKTRRSPRKAT
ncbi:hypothetical protein, partial [uncultured Hyphomicrobium sp.]|uniref:hypothetical protein n=1 Tax=uncultured Hyphomicrobium sp. TaxID=194373 RepID=UPI0025F6F349